MAQIFKTLLVHFGRLAASNEIHLSSGGYVMKCQPMGTLKTVCAFSSWFRLSVLVVGLMATDRQVRVFLGERYRPGAAVRDRVARQRRNDLGI